MGANALKTKKEPERRAFQGNQLKAVWYKVAISLLENLLITVFKFMRILKLWFQSAVILPKMELHSNFVQLHFIGFRLVKSGMCLQKKEY